MNTIHVVRSKNRRTVGIQIMSDMSITIKVPERFPDSKINKLLEDHKDWIQQKQNTMKMRTADKAPDEYLYLGKKYQLATRHNQKSLIELEDKFYFALPNSKNVKTYLESWYKQQANKIIGERVKHYALIAGLTYKSVAITSAETRWGSCSSQKTLNFNWRLVMAPLAVIDYVVTHELAHLTELNHSIDFWETVRKMYPLYRQYRTWLRRYGDMLRI